MYIDDEDVEFVMAFGWYSERFKKLCACDVFNLPSWAVVFIYTDLYSMGEYCDG